MLLPAALVAAGLAAGAVQAQSPARPGSDDRSAQLLLMRHRFGWTLERIGKAVGLGTSAVDGRLRRLTALLVRRAKKEGMK